MTELINEGTVYLDVGTETGEEDDLQHDDKAGSDHAYNCMSAKSTISPVFILIRQSCWSNMPAGILQL